MNIETDRWLSLVQWQGGGALSRQVLQRFQASALLFQQALLAVLGQLTVGGQRLCYGRTCCQK